MLGRQSSFWTFFTQRWPMNTGLTLVRLIAVLRIPEPRNIFLTLLFLESRLLISTDLGI